MNKPKKPARPFRRHRPVGGDRDTGLSGHAGKGDGCRIDDKEAFDRNYDAICWTSKKTK
jgi:hypothetical protein